MKQSLFYSIGLLFLALLLPYKSAAQERISKQINESHAFTQKGELSIENKYGDIYLNGWSQDAIQITVNIDSKGKNAAAAKDLLDRIQPSIAVQGDRVVVTTNITKKEENLLNRFLSRVDSNKGEKANSQIDYTIYLPQNAKVKLTNKYGDLIVSGWNGNLTATVEHGDIRLPDQLQESVLSVKFGKLKATELINSEVISRDARININKATQLALDANGSDINLEEIGALELISDKDEIEVGHVKLVQGEVKYSTVNINNLSDRISLNLNLAELKIVQFSSSTPSVRIDQQNSEVYLNISNTSFKFDANLEQGVLRIPKTMKNITSELVDTKRKIRSINATYGEGDGLIFSFSGLKGQIILKEL